MKAKRENLLPAIMGIVGVTVGLLITGIFQLQTTKATLKKDISIETSQGSRVMHERLVDLASDYMTDLIFLALERDSDIATKVGFEKLREFQQKSIKLSLHVGPQTSLQIIHISVNAQKLFKFELESPERIKATEEFAENYANLYKALYAESSKYRLRSTPNAFQDEALLTLVQSMLIYPNKAKEPAAE